MRASRLWAAAVLLPVMAACGGGGDAAESAPDTTAMGAATDTAMAPPSTQPQGGMVDTASMTGSTGAAAGRIALNPVGSSGASGDVTATPQGSGVQVMIHLTGVKQPGVHQGHVHQGTCDAPGSVVAPLEPITTDASGAGMSQKTLDVPMATLANGQHIVAYHEAGGSPGAPIVCGAIPAQQGA